ncbi:MULTISPECIES: glycosyltransferase [Halorussus]|uniref:glycosyltransferase n=1 Tax=Halorussus TaxID=1070314 RepID=UPI00209DEC24|nr:glycosyltransferase family 2 protein [Halorussus vallis]USZ76485.1 glycosyltransferase family 2 protein [Halorussus vallis]
MEVRSADETSNTRSAVTYVAASTLASATLVSPAFVFPAYGRLVSTLVVLLFLGLAARVVFAAAVAFRPPPDPESSSSGNPTADELPEVSVVVAAYDEAETLPATLAACRALDYPAERLEVLLCYEAASTDATAEIAERAAADDPRFRAIRRDAPPGGKAAVANFGRRRAGGEVVGFVDAGQRPEPDAVRRAVDWFRADEDVWCVKGRCYAGNSAGSPLALHAAVERHLAERGEFFAREVLSGFTLFTGGLAFFRASAFAELGPFDETVLLEDVEFAARIHARGWTVKVDPAIVSTETNPETFAGWWNRRKRWARGGLQVARRYVGSFLRRSTGRPVASLDAVATFGGLLALPVALLASPTVALGYVAGDGSPATYLPEGPPFVALAAVVLAGAFLAPLSVLLRDHLDGRPHPAREYAAALTLPAYFAVEAAVVVAAFLDEFVLRRPAVYVPSDRPGAGADRGSEGDD